MCFGCLNGSYFLQILSLKFHLWSRYNIWFKASQRWKRRFLTLRYVTHLAFSLQWNVYQLSTNTKKIYVYDSSIQRFKHDD